MTATQTDIARTALAHRLSPNPLMWQDEIPGRLEYTETRTDGTHIALVSPDRAVTFKGVLWVKQQGVK